MTGEPTRFDALSYLEHHASERGQQPAIFADGVTISFDDLLSAVYAMSGDLIARGVRPGDVVAVALPNVWRFVALEIAVPAVGAVLLPLSSRLGTHELQSALARTGAVLLFVDQTWLESDVAGSLRRTAGLPVGLQVVDVAELPTRSVAAPAELGAHRSADPDRVVQIAPTSGTTGLPKLACLSARLKQLTCEGFTSRLEIGQDDRMLPMSPITQGVGEMCLYALRAGAALVMAHDHRFDAAATLRLVERSRTTILGGVPTMLGRLLHAPELAETELGSLRATITAGSALAREVAEAWERRSGSATCSFYGAMDIGQLAVPRPDDPAEKRWTTVGMPHDAAEWLIADPVSGAPLPRGEVGDVCMRGPLVQERYWGEQSGPFSEDGWAHFGDLGFVDDEGYLHIVGRIKDTIIRGGSNINPLEIEQVLLTHPSVSDACVVGRPDADLGERAVAFVVTTSAGFDVGDVAALFSGHGLARYKWPETVVCIDALPLGSTGKVDRQALRRSLTGTTDRGGTVAAQ